jgi:preprotein translocase subunit SecA
MKVLSALGMKEGDAIEHPMLSKSVERAQRKVEERNFQIRKNILEYDEVMEHQRQRFYGLRQRVLEGRDVKGLIFEYIEDAVDDASPSTSTRTTPRSAPRVRPREARLRRSRRPPQGQGPTRWTSVIRREAEADADRSSPSRSASTCPRRAPTSPWISTSRA